MKTRTITTFSKEEEKTCGENIFVSNDLIIGEHIRISTKELVWFGSLGKDVNGNSIKAYNVNAYDKNAQANRQSTINKNYSQGLLAISNTLQQKLQILKGELLYHSDFGLPLFDKNKSKLNIDASIIEIVTNTEGVKDIVSFNSYVDDKTYKCDFSINTIYGILTLSIQ